MRNYSIVFFALLVPVFSQITVESVTRTTVPAEFAELVIPIKVFGSSQEEAAENLNKAVAEVEAVLKTVKLKDNRIERSQVNTFVGGDPRSGVTRRADQFLRVELTDPTEFAALARKLQDTQAEIRYPTFSIGELSEAEHPARKSTILAARTQAAFIAKTLGIELGTLSNVEQRGRQSQWRRTAVVRHVAGQQFSQSRYQQGGARDIRGTESPSFELNVPSATFLPPLVSLYHSVEASFGQAVERAIAVSGSASTNVMPDQVTLVFQVQASGKSEQQAADALKPHVLELEKRMRAERALKKNSLRFDPVSITEQTYKSGSFSKAKSGGGKTHTTYSASMRVVCKLLDISTLPLLRKDLAELGQVTVSSVRLDRSDAAEINRSLLKAALIDAERTKQELAKNFDSPIGTAVAAKVNNGGVYRTGPFESLRPSYSGSANANFGGGGDPFGGPADDFFGGAPIEELAWENLSGAIPDPTTKLEFSTRVQVQYKLK